MSAGAVVVKTKQGRTPYEIWVKTVPDTKAVSLTKGYALGSDKGFLNASIDYANAMKDIRTVEESMTAERFRWVIPIPSTVTARRFSSMRR